MISVNTQGNSKSKKPAVMRIPEPLLAVFMLGAVSQVGQVLLLRELLMVFHGNELSIGLILASWLVWVGLGSRLGASLAGRSRSPGLPLVLSSAGLVVFLPATILLIRRLRGFFSLLPGAYPSLIDKSISSFLLLAPVCLLLGLQFVFLSRIWREREQKEDTSGAEKTYIGEAVGNMLGGILFAVLIVHYLNSFQTAVLVGSLMLAAVLFTIRKDAGFSRGWYRPAGFGILILAVITFPFLEEIDTWAHRIYWRHFAPQYRLLETHQSKHGAISVLRHEDQYSFFQSGHLLFSTAGPQAPAPGLEEQEAAVFAHFSMVQHQNPEEVLLIGGGLRGTLAEILKHPVERIDYIELDEVLTEAARPHLQAATRDALSDPRVRTLHTDGRLFVKGSGRDYDLIIVDIPDPTTAVLNRYYTREFFLEAQKRLKTDGVLIIDAGSTPDLRGSAVANRNTTIYHTLKSVFSRVLPAGERSLFYVATDSHDQITIDPSILQERYRGRDIETEGFSAHSYQTLLEESQLRRVNWIVRSHGRSPGAHLEGPGAGPLIPAAVSEQEQQEQELPPVEQDYFINSDFRPIGYYYTLIFWHELTGAGEAQILRWLLRFRFWWLYPLFSVPLLLAGGLRVFGRHLGPSAGPHFAVLFTVFATGLSTMALEIALLFSFQSIYGFVYELVGLIVAIFMLGLALGAYLTHRHTKDKVNLHTLAGIQLLMAILAVLIGIALPRAAAVEYPAVIFALFSMLTFLAGLINGFDFPLAAACCMALTRRAEKSAGTVYGVELFGACAGAVLASVVLAPVLGIVACCLFAGLASFTAFTALLISGGSSL